MIEAEFENGILRPMRRLALRQGERVGIVVVRRAESSRWDTSRLAAGSAEEATLSGEGLAEWGAALDREDQK